MDRIKKIIELEKRGAKLPENFIRRDLINSVLPWLDKEEIIVITGARQTGKSVFLFQLIYEHLIKKTTDIHYFNLDNSKDLSFFETSDNLIKLIRNSKDKVYVLIDEVQRLKEPGLFLKEIYDLNLPIKLIVSGSSALEIKSKIHEPLTGRKQLFHFHPFSLNELLKAFNLLSAGKKNKQDLQGILNSYLVYGGYPKVVLEPDKEIKIMLLEEIFSSYLDKDVKPFLQVSNETAFINLVKILSSQIGNLINKDELSRSIGIHKNTLANYLFYLEQTFIISFARPFYTNVRKELLKTPKIYFCDTGIRNFAVQGFSDIKFRPDKGSLVENLVCLMLKEKIGRYANLRFWRTKANAEVDFIVLRGLSPIPFEVKAQALQAPKITRSLRSFLKTYKPKTAYCVNLTFKGVYFVENIPVHFITIDEIEHIKLCKDY